MNSPLEFRFFMRRWQRDDYIAGVQAIPQKLADGTREVYCPAVLQWRVRGKNGEWSEWEEVPYVREGEGA